MSGRSSSRRHGKHTQGDFDKNGIVARNREVSGTEKPVNSWRDYLKEISSGDPKELGQAIR